MNLYGTQKYRPRNPETRKSDWRGKSYRQAGERISVIRDKSLVKLMERVKNDSLE